MDGGRTTERQHSEYSEKNSTQREPEYDRDIDRHQRKSTQFRWGGRDGRREPDSGLGYTQDYRSQRRAAGEKRGVEGRPANDQIPEVTGIHRNSQWDFPRKRALFTMDEPDSTTPVSGTQEGHMDRPPDVEYSNRRMTEKRQDKGRTERLGSPHMILEMAVTQLQKYLEDSRAEFEITRKLTPAIN